MKRNAKWIVVCLLILAIIAWLIFPVGKSFTLPFEAEDVSSVILWSFWGYKEVTDAKDIVMIVEKMNAARLCGEFDFESYEPRAGDYSYTACFFLKDGRDYEYVTWPKPGLTSIFKDADGTYYKAKDIPLESIYEDIDQELQYGNPFKSE